MLAKTMLCAGKWFVSAEAIGIPKGDAGEPLRAASAAAFGWIARVALRIPAVVEKVLETAVPLPTKAADADAAVGFLDTLLRVPELREVWRVGSRAELLNTAASAAAQSAACSRAVAARFASQVELAVRSASMTTATTMGV